MTPQPDVEVYALTCSAAPSDGPLQLKTATLTATSVGDGSFSLNGTLETSDGNTQPFAANASGVFADTIELQMPDQGEIQLAPFTDDSSGANYFQGTTPVPRER